MSAADLRQGLDALRRGDAAHAVHHLRIATAAPASAVEAWHYLALAHARLRQWEDSRRAIAQAMVRAPRDPALRLGAANIEQDAGDRDAAVARLHEALALRPDFAEAHNNLGILLAERGDLDAARAHFESAMRSRPAYARALANLASVLIKLHRVDEAVPFASEAIAAEANNAHAWLTRGHAHLLREALPAAESDLTQALRLHPALAEAGLLLGQILHRQKRFDEGAEMARALANRLPGHPEVLTMFGDMLAAQDDLVGARAAWQAVLAIEPAHLTCRARIALALPGVQDSLDALLASRRAYESGVAALAEQLAADPGPPAIEALQSALKPPFFLAYQGLDDRDLQRRYAQLIEGALGRAAPAFYQPMPRRARTAGRLRIGFYCRYLHTSTVGNYFSSWITGLDRARYTCHVFSPHRGSDPLNDRLRAGCDEYVETGGALLDTAARLRAADLDVLVYPEVGMDDTTKLLSTMRLAPLQIAGWGHPVTTGHTHLDVFVSCAAMEPPDAAGHYTESLALLPGLGTAYPSPATPESRQTRADFGLPEGRLLVLYPQSLFKIHPDNDAVVARVLQGLPDAVLVMFAGFSRASTARYAARLQAAFAQHGVNPAGRVKVLPALSHDAYRRVNALCDLMLDTLHWSGGNTSLDAIGAGLPIVTAPGRFMRGRQSAAMLRLAGCDEGIAADADELVARTVALGQDDAARKAFSNRLVDAQARLFDDPAPVRAWNDLLASLVAARA